VMISPIPLGMTGWAAANKISSLSVNSRPVEKAPPPVRRQRVSDSQDGRPLRLSKGVAVAGCRAWVWLFISFQLCISLNGEPLDQSEPMRVHAPLTYTATTCQLVPLLNTTHGTFPPP
jgi:hypothetical protein